MPVNSSMRRRYRQNIKKSPCRGLKKENCKSKTNCMRTRRTEKKKSYCRLITRKKNRSNKRATLAYSTTSSASKSKSKTASNSSSLSFFDKFNNARSRSPNKTSSVTGD